MGIYLSFGLYRLDAANDHKHNISRGLCDIQIRGSPLLSYKRLSVTRRPLI